MAYDLEDRVTILEITVRSEAEQRVKMSKDIGKLGQKVDAHFNAQRHLFQALQETQSEHTALLHDIRDTLAPLPPKIDLLETQVAGLNTRMDGLSTQVTGLDTRMGRVETRMDKLDTRMDGLDTRMDALDTRMGRVEIRMDGLDHRMERVETKVENLDGKIDAVGERLDTKIDSVIDLIRNGQR